MIINHKPQTIEPVVVNFGWYTVGTSPQRQNEYQYQANDGTNTYTYARGGSLNSVVTIPSIGGSISDITITPYAGVNAPSFSLDNGVIMVVDTTEGVFTPPSYTTPTDLPLNVAVVRYVSNAGAPGTGYDPTAHTFHNCTLVGSENTIAITQADVIDIRFYDDALAQEQVVYFDAIDSYGMGLPKCVLPAGVGIISYDWEFNFGSSGSGPVATTIFPTTAIDTRVQLTITDTRGLNFSCSKYVQLVGSAEGPLIFYVPSLRVPISAWMESAAGYLAE